MRLTRRLLRSIVRRYLPALLLGIAGLCLNRLTVPILTPETPQFVFGGALVLLAFVWLGEGPGLLAAFVSIALLLSTHDAAGLATGIYVLEAWGTYRLYRRSGSLVFSIAVFWGTAGLVLDVLVYGAVVGLDRDYLVLLFVKQVVNGILNAIVAETVLRGVGAVSSRFLRAPSGGLSLHKYAFARVAYVVMAPCLAMSLLYAHAAYEGHIGAARIREMRASRDAAVAVRGHLEKRREELQRLARQIEIGGIRTAEQRLDEFRDGRREIRAVGLVDGAGTPSAVSPPALRAAAADLRSRGAFDAARATLGAAYAAIDPPADGSREAALAVVEPVLDGRGAPAGAVFAIVDSGLVPLLEASRRHPGEALTVFDERRRVVASLDPVLAPGSPLEGQVPIEALSGDGSRSFAYFPPADGTPGSRLGINLRHSAYQPLALAGWGVLVDLPARSLHAEMTGSAFRMLVFILATLVLLHAAIHRFSIQVSGPLATINRAANDIAAGRYPWESRLELLARSPIAEIQDVAADFARMQDSLAYNDLLTGLPNRQLFLDRLSLGTAQARRSRESLAVFFLDLDRFRIIEDSLGHDTGDDMLREVARRLSSCVRQGDTVARLGADEFVFVIRQIQQVEDAARIAQKLLDAVRPPFPTRGRELFVTASIGISFYPGDGTTAETLLKNAESAMYRAKEQRGDAYRLYTPAMNDRALERLALENALRRALTQGDLVLHYQPLVELDTGNVRGVEALVRWRHPEMGLLPPARFISLAELSGLIVSLDTWVLQTACAQTRLWHAQGHDSLAVAVNLSARQFQQPDLLEHVTESLRQAGLEPSSLAIEITESTAIQNVEATVQTLRGLRRLGVRIAVDDFGTGYSSLSYLKRLPVDAVKLDQSFVRDLTTDPDDAAIAKAVIAMAHSLRLRVVAEGVETPEQLAFLRRHRCDSIQGHLFSPALSPDELERFLGEVPRLHPA